MQPAHQKINLREERNFGEKLNAAFLFIQLNFSAFWRCLFLFVTPVALTASILLDLYRLKVLQQHPEDAFADELNWLGLGLTVLLSLPGIFMLYLTVYCFVVVYQDEAGEVQVKAIWKRIKQNLWKGLQSGLAILLIIFLSFFLLGLGLYLGVVLSLFLMVLVREELSFRQTMARCFYLVKKSWWETSTLLLAAGLLQGLLSGLAILPTGLLYFLESFGLPGTENKWLLLVANTFSSVLSVYLLAIPALTLAFQYFHLVEQKDGIGLLAKAELIGSQTLNNTANEGHF